MTASCFSIIRRFTFLEHKSHQQLLSIGHKWCYEPGEASLSLPSTSDSDSKQTEPHSNHEQNLLITAPPGDAFPVSIFIFGIFKNSGYLFTFLFSSMSDRNIGQQCVGWGENTFRVYILYTETQGNLRSSQGVISDAIIF